MVSPRACIVLSARETARILRSLLGRLLHVLKRKLGVASPQQGSGKKANPTCHVIEAHKLIQVQAGEVVNVDQPKVSALKRGRLTDFSIARLVGFLLILGRDVQITVMPKPRSSRIPPTLEVNAMGAVAPARRQGLRVERYSVSTGDF
jgi:Helix-turn-helix domain